MKDEPLLRVTSLSKSYGPRVGCQDVSFELWPGEVLAVVGESGSGKTTLLNCVSTRLLPSSGTVSYRMRDEVWRDLYRMNEAERRFLMRTDWGFVHQNPADGLRMTVSAGANVGERLMAVGDRHYGRIRETAIDWLERVEIAEDRVDDQPRAFSGGMRQRLQIARNLVTSPRLIFMDEPTGGLDVSVQARLLDLLRGLVSELGLAAIVVTHDLAVARLLSHRIMVMKDGAVVETGLTDRVLDDPRQPYTQLLVSSILQV
ncbi:MAG: phosphonate C-P lyase system protein PhnK [Rhizobiaceae bacterium]|nr:phosphonate C-P lyase system protein PhnK [Rhizobiaceae bacterium]